MIIASLSNYIVDVALLFRVVAVYPRTTTPRTQLLAILALPLALKVLRVVEWIVWSIDGVRRASLAVDTGYIQSDLQRACAVIRWAFAAVDNTYVAT
jgi:hypothetical protein